ncbi:protein of unknown function [Candidatus Methylomirabilis oxygeniifera]|uniref:Uncharacterized protein n=1 Tax=Methylomirabilis oxygeniifera TaxID=671143 RepID=D5MEW8_METO1|nr:protein of unknown function [Candidatus Methylomirabilis oxyfera]
MGHAAPPAPWLISMTTSSPVPGAPAGVQQALVDQFEPKGQPPTLPFRFLVAAKAGVGGSNSRMKSAGKAATGRANAMIARNA